ncbi:MAG TPA: glycosyltransferase 87 family protein, partial [Chthoniobacteraceae bacterium]
MTSPVLSRIRADLNPRTIVILLAALAFLAKLYCAATTFGSSDVLNFWYYARYIRQFGLLAMYRETAAFNHTPLVGWFVAHAQQLADDQQHMELFPFYLRLPVIFADLIAVFALIWLREKTGRPSWWAIGLFAASPVSFMVSGFHGNIDSLMVTGLLLSVAACVAGRAELSGFFFGLSCNFKVIPLLLVPALFFFWFQRRRALRFTLPAAATILIGWSVPLFTIPLVFKHNVLDYSSIWGVWGIPFGLRMTGLSQFQGILFTDKTPAETHLTTALKLATIATVVFWAWYRRREEPMNVFKTLAFSFSVFFMLAPGFGAQYLLWPAPFFLAAADSWYLALTVLSSLGLGIYYTASCDGRVPWYQATHMHRTIAV